MLDRYSRLFSSTIVRAGLGAGALFLVGCTPASSEAGQGGEYTRYVMSLYNDPATPHGLRSIEFPINIAAAQIGMTAPDPTVLDKIQKSPDVFARVESLPAEEQAGPPDPANRNPIRRLQSMARDQGADYLLIYGATVETHTRVNSFSVVDLSIVGAYAPITRGVEATARGSAALIDVRTGNVVLSAGSEAKGSDLASAASAESIADQVSQKVHDESLLKLADQVIAAAKRRASEEAAMDDAPAIRHATPAVAQEK